MVKDRTVMEVECVYRLRDPIVYTDQPQHLNHWQAKWITLPTKVSTMGTWLSELDHGPMGEGCHVCWSFLLDQLYGWVHGCRSPRDEMYYGKKASWCWQCYVLLGILGSWHSDVTLTRSTYLIFWLLQTMYIAMAFPDGNAKTLQEGFEEHDKVFKVFALAS